MNRLHLAAVRAKFARERLADLPPSTPPLVLATAQREADQAQREFDAAAAEHVRQLQRRVA